MKTHVIHLDKHDDIVSIRDRMVWAKSARILLVWPRRGRVDIRPLDLTLLRRHAESLGAELGLVTRDGELCSVAREEGISYFSSAFAAQKKEWQVKKPARPVRRFPRADFRDIRKKLPGQELFSFVAYPVRRLAVFFSGVFAVLVVMLVFIPSAEVSITPPVRQQTLTIAVSADPEAQTVQLSGIVPQRTLTQVVEGSDSALSTGKTILSDRFASGRVLLMNLSEKAVQVPAGTVLLIPGNIVISFETDSLVLVPGGKGKTATVSLRAKSGGLSGNVTSGVINTFEGELGKTLAVTNPFATSGGGESELPIPTEQDRFQLKKRLLVDLEQTARARFWEQISDGDVLLPASFKLVHIQDESSSPAEGQTGKTLSLTLRVEYSMAFTSFADLHSLATRVLDASLQAGTAALPDPIMMANLTTPSMSAQGFSHWQMSVTRSIRPSIKPGDVIALVTGRVVKRASDLLSDTYGLAQVPQIQIHPDWWPWLPFLPIRIFVTG